MRVERDRAGREGNKAMERESEDHETTENGETETEGRGHGERKQTTENDGTRRERHRANRQTSASSGRLSNAFGCCGPVVDIVWRLACAILFEKLLDDIPRWATERWRVS